MATTTNYGWTTPDDTALVKDGAAAIRTLGSSVDTTTKALNPSTTLGDIEYRSSTANTNTRLGIGSTGQVLTVAGGVPSWATSTSGGLTLINTGGTTLSGTTTTVSSIPGTYKHLLGIVEAAYGTNQDNNTGLRFNSDTGSNYHTVEIYWGGSGAPGAFDNSGTRLFRFLSLYTSTGANDKGYGSFFIPNYAGSGLKAVQMQGRSRATASANYGIYSQGLWNSADAITSVSVASDYSISGGTLFLYGVS